MSHTQKRPEAGAQSTPTSPAAPVEFSHPDKVSPRDSEAPSALPTVTPFLA